MIERAPIEPRHRMVRQRLEAQMQWGFVLWVRVPSWLLSDSRTP